ncbi:hypothetical protein HELRODRAFT_184368 [Helobdella robusta]|uniref:Uncharacterized protein n=1 Tax=Helobdella robusta TaxID=6412 RepID=T1FL25_HELRO|nr:hypothetical protein HELRODRAFT_184368 [Helobdella robusta]ESO00133.1 hypothetical protein HELRODRAFT_184368 [Helobdella robusta]
MSEEISRFDGTGCLKTFLKKFEICARYNNWNLVDMEAYLSCSLTGEASQVLWDLTGLGYQELVSKLEDRFGTRGHEESYRYELQILRRKPGESLRELSMVTKRLMSLAYPGEQSRLATHLARAFFLSALDNAELELKVREKEPKNIDDALRFAQRLEVSKMVVDSSHRFDPQVKDFQAGAENMESMVRQIAFLQKSFEELRNKRVQPTVSRVEREKICFNCKKPEVTGIVDGLVKDIPKEAREELTRILISFSDRFSCASGEIGAAKGVFHKIDTQDARPVKQPRRHPPAHQKVIAEQRLFPTISSEEIRRRYLVARAAISEMLTELAPAFSLHGCIDEPKRRREKADQARKLADQLMTFQMPEVKPEDITEDNSIEKPTEVPSRSNDESTESLVQTWTGEDTPEFLPGQPDIVPELVRLVDELFDQRPDLFAVGNQPSMDLFAGLDEQPTEKKSATDGKSIEHDDHNKKKRR